MASTRPAKPLVGDGEARREAFIHQNYTVKCGWPAETVETAQALNVSVLCAEKSALDDRDFIYHLRVARTFCLAALRLRKNKQNASPELNWGGCFWIYLRRPRVP